MAARKYLIANPRTEEGEPAVVGIGDPAAHAPVASPALALQSALREAGFETTVARHNRRLHRLMLGLSLICAYALGMLMLTGQVTA